MATSSFGAATASAAASLTENARKSSCYLPLCHRRFVLRASSNKISFRLSPRPKLCFSSKGLQSGWSRSSVVKSQLDEVAGDAPTKAAEPTPSETEDAKSPDEASVTALATEESVSAFITQVASLVKLVDSSDIVELKLKQLDCEVLLRKEEALPPPPPAPISYVQSQPQPAALPQVSAPPPVLAAASSPATTPAPSPPATKPSKSSSPPFKCPMAGTFYRSPGPDQPPFVKVGDRVEKGQIMCIIEAMKLMNEIEADQSGTVVEIFAEDGKPVSVGTHLFVIEP